MREPRKRQQEAAAARNYVAPVERSANIFDMPLDEFQGALVELRSQGLSQDRIDDLMRQYRAQASPFAGINEAATASQGAIADAGRRPVAGGLLSKPEGATGMDAVRGLQFEGMNGLLGALSGAGQAVDAPMAAARGLIPQGDMALEALGTAGAAMTGGGAAVRPAGSVGMGGRVVDGDFGENWSDAYHWTRSQEPFDQFDPDKSTSAMSQLGPHVGTQSAAQARTLAFPNESGTMMSLRANTEKPFLNPRTNEPWSEIGLESFISAFADEQGIDRRDAAPMMRRMLAAEGYTDVPYINDIEDAGSISNIMLVDRPSDSDAVLRRSDAAFNPARRTDPDLLAANANTSGGLLAAVASRLPPEKVNKDVLDPLGYASNRLDDYLDNTQLGLTDLGENLPRISRSWEDLEGGYVLPLYGDRTSRGYNLESINDTYFSRPVYTEGGIDFMRGPANQLDDAVWASAKHVIDNINNSAIRTANLGDGRPIYGVTGSMAPNGVDFANMTGEAMAELVMGNRGRIDPAAARVFDDIMMNRDVAYPGLLSNELRDWAGGATSETRKSFIRGLDTKPMRGAGVPSAGLARYGVTDPTLRDVPSGQFGSAAAELRPELPLLYNNAGGNSAPRAPHSTYNTQLLGNYLGELPLIPQGLLFRDAYDRMATQLDKRGNLLGEANKTYSIKTQLQPQLITPQVVDGIMQYLSNRQGPQ